MAPELRPMCRRLWARAVPGVTSRQVLVQPPHSQVWAALGSQVSLSDPTKSRNAHGAAVYRGAPSSSPHGGLGFFLEGSRSLWKIFP